MTMLITYLVLLAVPLCGITAVGIAHEVDLRRYERKIGIRD